MKFLWYLFSCLTILLILVSSPKTNSLNNLVNQDRLIKLNKNNQVLLQKIIMISILCFFILTITCIIYL